MTVKGLNPLTLEAINAEFIRAFVKHQGRTPRSDEMSNGERLAIITEELGEVARCLTYDNSNPANLVKELIQLCAMGAAWIEHAETHNVPGA